MKDIVRMVFVLAVICAAAALGLARVYDVTKGPIAEARRQELLRAIRTVLPGFDNAPDQDVAEAGGARYYRGRKGSDLTGVAFRVSSAEGYAGSIDALVGTDPHGVVSGVVILSHLETPGLGAKFENPAYLAQFSGKSLRDATWAVRKDGGDFDQITGATITPRALIAAMREGLEMFGKNREEVVTQGSGQGAGSGE